MVMVKLEHTSSSVLDEMHDAHWTLHYRPVTVSVAANDSGNGDR